MRKLGAITDWRADDLMSGTNRTSDCRPGNVCLREESVAKLVDVTRLCLSLVSILALLLSLEGDYQTLMRRMLRSLVADDRGI
jgi:hypothetical protein